MHCFVPRRGGHLLKASAWCRAACSDAFFVVGMGSGQSPSAVAGGGRKTRLGIEIMVCRSECWLQF